MRCLLCESLSFTHICKSCQITYLTPSIYKRKLDNNIEVISFYKYEEIKDLLHTKHTDIGYYFYKILAQNSFKIFAQNFNYIKKIISIAIDDNPKDKYSHTAILNHSLKSKSIKPIYSKLRATSSVTYSGQTKEFRLNNPRNFELLEFSEKSIILVDDIITTGSTLNQAITLLHNKNKEVLFCIVLTDVNIK